LGYLTTVYRPRQHRIRHRISQQIFLFANLHIVSSPPRHQTSVPAIDVEEQQLLLFSALVEPPAPLTFLEVLGINQSHPIFSDLLIAY
jgi:hypothetical protein